MRKLLVLFLMAVSITSLSAKVVLPDIIASHMVLQQCDSIKLWGHGSSGTVKLLLHGDRKHIKQL